MKGMQFKNLLLVQNFDITYQISQEISTLWGHLSFLKKRIFQGCEQEAFKRKFDFCSDPSMTTTWGSTRPGQRA